MYLSDRKLRQFDNERTPGWRRRIRDVTAKAPLLMGEVSLGLSDPPDSYPPSLKKVLRELDSSDEPPIWYEDDVATPGMWIYFEAPLDYTIASCSREDQALIFTQYPRSFAEEVRLLLHGSLEHLVGVREDPVAEAMARRYFSVSTTARFLDFLERLDEAPEHVASPIEARASRGLTALMQTIDNSRYSRYAFRTASWMAGVARVSFRATVSGNVHLDSVWARTQSLLVASPLYVEYTSAPPGEDSF